MTEAERRKIAVGMACRAYRKRLGWSQEKTAFAADISRNHYGNVENGKPSVAVDKLWKLANAFGVEPSDLMIEAERIHREGFETGFV